MRRSKRSSAEWLRIALCCLPSRREAAWAILYDFGCLGLEELDEESSRAYFDMGVDREALLTRLRAEQGVRTVSVAVTPAENWHARWLESYRSFRVGRFFIRPSWRDDPVDAGLLEIVLDPGGAFGTGTHETTRLCLSLLPDVIAMKRSMIDVGCGSGILSIAARKCSPEIRLLALDNDPEAAAVCAENARLNNTPLEVVCGELAATRHAPDLVVANLQLDILIASRSELTARLRPGAELLLSGILESQVGDVRAIYEPDFELRDTRTEQEWAAVVYRRR